MTAVVQLPAGLIKNERKGDKLAAFTEDECRGIGKRINPGSGSKPVYFILIQGRASEQSRIYFKYYSAHTSYLYKTDTFLHFKVDGDYGTADDPKILNLQHLH